MKNPCGQSRRRRRSGSENSRDAVRCRASLAASLRDLLLVDGDEVSIGDGAVRATVELVRPGIGIAAPGSSPDQVLASFLFLDVHSESSIVIERLKKNKEGQMVIVVVVCRVTEKVKNSLLTLRLKMCFTVSALSNAMNPKF